MPIPIHNARHDGVSVGACAYDEKEDEQEGLEIEECGHLDKYSLGSPFYLGGSHKVMTSTRKLHVCQVCWIIPEILLFFARILTIV